jgi:multidrug efflux pump subunit AcrA (membrane-fusion protein)
LTKDAKDPAVWLVDNDSKVALQRVTVGRYLTGQVIISDGLDQGQRVVIAGGQLLHPGMQVEVAGEVKQ